MDPTDEEEVLCLSSMQKSKPLDHGIITQAMLPQLDQISELFLVGCMDVTRINSSMEILSQTNNEIYPLLQESLQKSILRMLKKRKEDIES